ncbi:hypothetical protein FEM48_ZijujUnG0054300 [Ziziphus jujuba var. spinosa]|uniref:Transmembrane protein n=1 Tax=Ziziphus jujuba var. spinosa TaxID=714518 RepID=A0A978U981_ZIZJJ|nr:hypothetical protein FEM48_ZijujUnG0097400 [Ziziphus jujuba var. spinosa]KAH7511090.1 hypothetical protein FEM48_ZijujUnG0054300 [Ziziphus jujuba var. spinosa]
MAANCARRTVQVSSGSVKTLMSFSSSPSPFASRASKLSGLAASKPNFASRFSVPKLKFSRFVFLFFFFFFFLLYLLVFLSLNSRGVGQHAVFDADAQRHCRCLIHFSAIFAQ